MLPLVVCASLLKQGSIAADFFPLDKGAKWTYTREAGGSRQQLVQIAGSAVRIGNEHAVPVQPDVPGAPPSYYEIKDNVVYLVGYDPKYTFNTPIPVLHGSTGPEKWTWQGTVNTMYIDLSVESQSLGKRNILGQDREVLQVKTIAKVSTTQTKWTDLQTALYAKGIGLCEMSDQSAGMPKSKVLLKLIAFEQGHP